MRPEEVIYDWNVRGHAMSPPMRRVQLRRDTA